MTTITKSLQELVPKESRSNQKSLLLLPNDPLGEILPLRGSGQEEDLAAPRQVTDIIASAKRLEAYKLLMSGVFCHLSVYVVVPKHSNIQHHLPDGISAACYVLRATHCSIGDFEFGDT